jgi:hypothetical protein
MWGEPKVSGLGLEFASWEAASGPEDISEAELYTPAILSHWLRQLRICLYCINFERRFDALSSIPTHWGLDRRRRDRKISFRQRACEMEAGFG